MQEQHDSSLFKQFDKSPVAEYLNAIALLLVYYEEISSWQQLKKILI